MPSAMTSCLEKSSREPTETERRLNDQRFGLSRSATVTLAADLTADAPAGGDRDLTSTTANQTEMYHRPTDNVNDCRFIYINLGTLQNHPVSD